MIERIKKIMEEENMSSGKFAEEIGIGGPRLSHYLSGRNNVSLDLVTKILQRFRGISPEWLLFGRGKMYKSDEAKAVVREPDLFSVTEQKQPVAVIDNDAEKSDTSTANLDFFEPEPLNHEEMPVPEAVQYNEPQHVTPVKNTPKEHASIEKIIVMYSDSTFDCYSPNGRKQ